MRSASDARFRRPRVVLHTALALLACFAVVGCDFNQKKREALAEGDRLYPTDQAAAVARYKEGYDAAGPRKAEVLQRIVDHEARPLNAVGAMKWIEKGLNEKLQVTYETPAARELLARVQRERAEAEAKKKAEKDAKEKVKREAEEKSARYGNSVDAYRYIQSVVKAELNPVDVKFGVFPDTKQNADGSWTSIGSATAKGAIGGKEKYLFKVTVRRQANGQWEVVESKVGFDPN
jgi:hypothetical protein